jgi:tripartite-type tricarboxylate transporter receptor subunit TctC
MRRALLLLALLAPLPAMAFPDRPVTIINPYATGSSTDAAARALADSFTRDLGQNVVVTSQSGGSGVVGMRALAAAAADGHTLAYSPLVPLAFQPHLVRNTGLGPDAVAPVCNVTENILGIMVKADSPWRTLADVVAAARQRPLTYGSPGPNSAPFLGVHRVQSAAGGQFTHVPFRGDGASLTEVIAGRLDFAAIVVASGVPMARSGQTRLIAVFSEGRHPAFPGRADGARTGDRRAAAVLCRVVRAARHARTRARAARSRLPRGDGHGWLPPLRRQLGRGRKLPRPGRIAGAAAQRIRGDRRGLPRARRHAGMTARAFT